MRLIKLAFVSVLVFGGILLIISTLIPSRVYVSRTVYINEPPDSLKTLLYNFQAWNRWMALDTGVAVRGNGNQVQIGNNTIGFLGRTDSSFTTSWTNPSGNRQVSVFYLLPQQGAKSTMVEWVFEQQVGWYPWEKFASIFNDKMMGESMKRSLDNLKQVAESNP